MNNYKNLSDTDLARLLKDGDDNAFSEIYQRYWAMMYLYARKLMQDNTAAEDIVQEVLAYIWTKRTELQINTSLPAYLYSSVRYRGLSVIQRSKVHDRYLNSLRDFTDKGEYVTDESIREKELIRNIEKAIAALPTKMRKIFELSRTGHYSQKMIAAELNISNKTVKNQVSNAVKILKLKIHQMVLMF